jgi:serine/threonine-protein kinase
MRPSKKPGQEGGHDSLAGEMAGEYRIGRVLGAGGFGVVYEAEHPVLKRRAAVKVLHERRSLDDDAVQRFIAEAQAASQIRHPNIVSTFSFGKLQNGRLFYAMDLLDGVALDAYLREQGRLPPERALALLRPVASALDALHAANVIHRDVKPANVFLSWESSGEVVPKLLDFGLIKLLGNTPIDTASGVLMGTPYYMAPEQCLGEPVDARSDVYALGVIFHELCAGKVPFAGETPSAVLIAHVMAPIPRLSEVNPDTPPELDAPLLAMLAKKPESRPASAGQAFAQLEEAALSAGLAPASLRLPRPQPRPADTAAAGEERTRRASSVGLSSSLGPQARDASTSPRARYVSFLIGGLLAVGTSGAIWMLWMGGAGRGASAGADSSALPPAPVPRAPASQQPATLDVPGALASAPPESPPRVRLTVRGAPEGAVVKLGDRLIGPAAEPSWLDRGPGSVVLTLEARGYLPRALTVVPHRDHELDAPMERVPPRPPRRGSASRDLENPF